jgi:hypothetical protein
LKVATPLRRLHLFEFEDFPWFPAAIRDLATDYLEFLQARFCLHAPAIAVLSRALETTRAPAVVDLCSGAGGPILAVHDALRSAGISVPFVLTDKYPHLEAFRRVSSVDQTGISYREESVDATRVPNDLPGLRTMFNTFHHFAPAAARAVLACAVEARQPIAIVEIPDRVMTTIVPLFLTPVFVAMATPFIRPFRWKRLLWTYLIPLVPLVCWWDGLVSQLRAYTADEMLELARGMDEFQWTAGRDPIPKSAGHITWLLGIPKS